MRYFLRTLKMSTTFSPLEWFHSGHSIALVIIIYIIALIVIYVITHRKEPWIPCIYRCGGDLDKDHPIWSRFADTYRGTDYFLVKDRPDIPREEIEQSMNVAKKCVITMWGLLHFVFYALLGFVCPKFFWQLFLISITWELMEWFNQCHCALDLFWNFAGLLVGVYLRQRFFPYM
jgi:hypothetical protein